MAMSYIWSFFLLASLVCAAFSGQPAALSAAALTGAQEGVTLSLSLAGALSLWSGVSKVMTESGLAGKLSNLLWPFLSRIFPETCRDAEALSYLSANFSSNLLGLGSAATPMGISCVRRMQMLSKNKARASNEMCRLIVMNTASIQLLPSTLCAIRAGLGAGRPFEILPAVWVSSIASVGVGLLAAFVLEDRL